VRIGFYNLASLLLRARYSSGLLQGCEKVDFFVWMAELPIMSNPPKETLTRRERNEQRKHVKLSPLDFQNHTYFSRKDIICRLSKMLAWAYNPCPQARDTFQVLDAQLYLNCYSEQHQNCHQEKQLALRKCCGDT